ncbi:MAG: hypothetical protein QOE51_3232 [Actinoplanes sp.]|nr:hypothetical protein [Actinoplanes sp.]
MDPRDAVSNSPKGERALLLLAVALMESYGIRVVKGPAVQHRSLGGGTIAWDKATGSISPHIHVTVGLKEHSATGHTSHLLGATVQFLTEMVIVEITEPALYRRKQQDLFDVPLLRFTEVDSPSKR